MARKAEPLPIGEDELLIERRFRAPVALVFKLWSQPELFVRWWGPKSFTCPSAKLDFREGGAWRASILSPDYPQAFMRGTYREIVVNEKIVMSFIWEHPGALDSILTVRFREEDGETVQSFHQTPFRSIEDRDSHIGGWSECLDKEVAFAEAEAGA